MNKIDTYLGWLWGLGFGATVLLLVQLAEQDLSQHATELPQTPHSASDLPTLQD